MPVHTSKQKERGRKSITGTCNLSDERTKDNHRFIEHPDPKQATLSKFKNRCNQTLLVFKNFSSFNFFLDF